MFTAFHHQKRVIPIMADGNILLVWEPGAGKTFPVLSASMFVRLPILIIVPAHLREQWHREAGKHVPLLTAKILDKTTVKVTDADFDAADIFICSYEYASELPRWKELRRQKWGAIALDEAHYLMNLSANRSRAILGAKLGETHGLVYAADCVWYLTGTPFTFPNQIYPILSRSFPEAIRRHPDEGPGLMTEREWENRFCIVKPDDKGFGEKIVGAKNIPELRHRLEPHLDKVKLTDATDMPELIVDDIPIRASLKDLTRGMAPELLSMYEVITETLLNPKIPDDEKLALLDEQGLVMAQLRNHIAALKVTSTVEIIRNELNSGVDKLLVFGWHREPLKALAAALKAPLITGGISTKQKSAALSDFIEGKAKVLVGQISAIGTGTDGIQAVCHRSLFMEPSWAYRENKQCVHRTYRTGQREPCHTSFITLVGSVDEYVSSVLKRNAEIIRKQLD